MKDKILYIIGVICSLPPVYSIVSWLIHFNTQPKMEHLELVEIYREDFLFGYAGDVYKLGLIEIFFGAVSIACLGVLLDRTGRIKDNRKALKSKIVRLSLLIIVSIFTFLNIWSLL
jgi:hypothetical protein